MGCVLIWYAYSQSFSHLFKFFDPAIQKIKLGLYLTKKSSINSFEVGTHFFKGNYPDSFSIQAFHSNKNVNIASLVKNSKNWITLISKNKLKPNSNIKIKNLNYLNKNFNFIKLNIYPDGGISRLRVFGKV